MKIELSYTTKLEEVYQDDNIIAILDEKLQATSPARTVDYVGLALDHIEYAIKDAKSAIKGYQEAVKFEEARQEYIKEEVAKWLEGTGLNKLDGIIVSSMTVNEVKPQNNLIIQNEEALINQGYFKTVLDETAVKQALQNGDDVEGAELEVVHVANKIRVNKKR